jgi:hypothetical protein
MAADSGAADSGAADFGAADFWAGIDDLMVEAPTSTSTTDDLDETMFQPMR